MWSRARARAPHRQRRERKAHFGELVQLDGSFHLWYETRAPRGCLMNLVDDATGRTLARLGAEETIWAAAAVLRRWVEAYGVPLALYTDWKNVYVRPEGFRCPRRRSDRPRARHAGGLIECARCGYKASATAGTIFDGTRIPLTVWFHAMWLLTNQKNGASARSLQRQLGLSRYETTWTVLHKLRRAMMRPGRDRLRGLVEVDETYVGGDEKDGKTCAAERCTPSPSSAWRLRNAVKGWVAFGWPPCPDASGRSLVAFVEASVEPGARVHTDGWEGYRGLNAKGYGHDVTNIKGSREDRFAARPPSGVVAQAAAVADAPRSRAPAPFGLLSR